jgi:hypothetical protein
MNKTIFNSLFSLLILATFTAYVNAQESKPKDTPNTKTVNTQELKSKEAMKSRYKAGQVWSYKTLPNETKSTFIVVKVENDPKLGNIIHIALRDLKIKNPRSADGITDTMNHLPFAEEAITKSAVKMLKEKADLPDFEEGYGLWREAFDQKRAGVYTITISEAVDVAEKSLNQ